MKTEWAFSAAQHTDKTAGKCYFVYTCNIPIDTLPADAVKFNII